MLAKRPSHLLPFNLDIYTLENFFGNLINSLEFYYIDYYKEKTFLWKSYNSFNMYKSYSILASTCTFSLFIYMISFIIKLINIYIYIINLNEGKWS